MFDDWFSLSGPDQSGLGWVCTMTLTWCGYTAWNRGCYIENIGDLMSSTDMGTGTRMMMLLFNPYWFSSSCQLVLFLSLQCAFKGPVKCLNFLHISFRHPSSALSFSLYLPSSLPTRRLTYWKETWSQEFIWIASAAGVTQSSPPDSMFSWQRKEKADCMICFYAYLPLMSPPLLSSLIFPMTSLAWILVKEQIN